MDSNYLYTDHLAGDHSGVLKPIIPPCRVEVSSERAVVATLTFVASSSGGGGTVVAVVNGLEAGRASWTGSVNGSGDGRTSSPYTFCFKVGPGRHEISIATKASSAWVCHESPTMLIDMKGPFAVTGIQVDGPAWGAAITSPAWTRVDGVPASGGGGKAHPPVPEDPAK